MPPAWTPDGLHASPALLDLQVWGLTQPQKVGVLCVALLLLLATLVMFFAGVGGFASKAAR